MAGMIDRINAAAGGAVSGAQVDGRAKYLYEINNPFLRADRSERNRGKEPLFYMYCYYGEGGKKYFAYHGADTPEWYIVKNGSSVKVDVRKIKLEYFDFKQISNFKDTGFELKTDPQVKEFLASMGVDPEKHKDHREHIIVKDNLFSQEVINNNFASVDKASLQFINYEDAEYFFKSLLSYICYSKKRCYLTAEYMKFYVDLLSRFDNKTLKLDINGIIPSKKIDGKRRWVNYREHEYASVFYSLTLELYQILAKERGYAEKVKVFPDICNGKGFKSWGPVRQRDFFGFCKAHLKNNDSLKKFKENTRDESQFEWFSLEVEKNEIKFGFGPHTAAYTAIKDVNFIYPADSMKKIRKNIEHPGPYLKESPEKINRFIKDWEDGKYGNGLILQELKLPKPEGSRLVLIRNSPEVTAEINKYSGVNKAVKDWQYYGSEQFFKKIDVGTTLIEECDKLASPLVVSIANNPKIADIPLIKQAGGSKFIYYTLRFLYVFYRVWAVVLNLEFNYLSWPYFLCIMSRIPADIVNLVYNAFVTQDEQTMIDSMAVIYSLVFMKTATKAALKALKLKDTSYKTAEKWFIANFKKYMLNPKMYPEFAKFGIDTAKLSAKNFMGLLNRTANGLAKPAKLAAAKAVLKSAKVKVKPGVKTGQMAAKAVVKTAETAEGRLILREAGGKVLNTAKKTATKKAVISTGTKLIVGAVALGVAIKAANPATSIIAFAADDSFPVGGDYYSDTSQFYRERYAFDKFEKARILFAALYKPKNDKDKIWNKFYDNPNIYIITEIANDESMVSYEEINGVTAPVIRVSKDALKARIDKHIKEKRIPSKLPGYDCRRCH